MSVLKKSNWKERELMRACLRDGQTQEALHKLNTLALSCRGSAGKVKMLQNNCGGHLTITTSSRRLYSCLSVSQPLVQLIISAVQGHLEAFSDGGHFVVSLATILVELSLKSDINRRFFGETFESLLTVCVNYLNSNTCKFKFQANVSDILFMRSYVKSVLSSKPTCRLDQDKLSHVTGIILEAFLMSLPRGDQGRLLPDNIHFLSFDGSDVSNSQLFAGLLIESPEMSSHHIQPLKVTTCIQDGKQRVKVAIISVSMSGDMDELIQMKYEVLSGVDTEAAILENLATFCQKLSDSGVSVVLCQRVMHPKLKRLLRQRDVVVVDRMGLQVTNLVIQLTDAVGITSVFTPVDLCKFGWLDDMTHKIVHSRSYLHLSNTDGLVTTLILCHCQEEILNEFTDVCKTTIHSLYQLLQCPYVLPGGGCWQTCLAAYIRNMTDDALCTLQKEVDCSKHTLTSACEIFAHSLERTAMFGSSDDFTYVTDESHHVFKRDRKCGNDVISDSDSCCCGCIQGCDEKKCKYIHKALTSVVARCSQGDSDDDSIISQDEFIDRIKTGNVIIDNFTINVSALSTAVLTACAVLKVGQFVNQPDSLQ